MLQCLSLKSPSAASTSVPNLPPATIDLIHPPLSQAGTSTDATPVQSPAINIRQEYTFYVQSNSFNDMYSRIHQEIEGEQIEFQFNNDDEHGRQLRLNQVLHPNRECVEEVLRHARRNILIDLVSNYFQHSENTTLHCLYLHQSVLRARARYDPLHKLLDVLPLDPDSLTQSQCDYAYEIFLQFDRLENPFPCSDSHNFQEIRRSFSELRQQLDRKLVKSQSRVNLVRRATTASALCIIGSAVAATVTAALIATHALVACPFCSVANLPRKVTKKELAHITQLDAAARGSYVLNNELDTIDRVVALLHDSVENHKLLIRRGLETGSDKYPISEVLKHLRKDHLDFIDWLQYLENHTRLYFSAVNRARNLLLQEIYLNQTSNS